MKTATPLLISIVEASFQLSLPAEEISALIRDGDLVAVNVRGHDLVTYESLTALARRIRRRKSVLEVQRA